jgi:hypothetical protein
MSHTAQQRAAHHRVALGAHHDERIVLLGGDPVDLAFGEAGHDPRLHLEPLFFEDLPLLAEDCLQRLGGVRQRGRDRFLGAQTKQQQALPGHVRPQFAEAVDDGERGRGKIRSDDKAAEHSFFFFTKRGPGWPDRNRPDG